MSIAIRTARPEDTAVIFDLIRRLARSLLDWNEPAIQFYRARGARLLDGWTMCRVDGDALIRLGGMPSPAGPATTGDLA